MAVDQEQGKPEGGAGTAAESGGNASLSGWLTPDGHRYCARIYYADTDFSGFVYHARYLEFLERGRSDYLRLVGIEHTALAEGEAAGAIGQVLVWVVRRMEINFIAPARIDDIIMVETRTATVSGARIEMVQSVSRQSANGEAASLISATVEAAIVTPEGKPRRFPKAWLQQLQPSQTAR
jgi:acyl-CoA thioester hydrolase